ncbi:MAG TPA: hypothetical protein VGR78_07750 [Verrucomicrobiae bacterium]|jgi:hypothetical protein|nr:hypothetical protein [Verrucomicrobiae bacterium]
MKPVYRFGVLLLVGVAVAVLLALLVKAPDASAPWFTNGNGYDALVQAAAQMNGRPDDDAAAFVRANGRLFELVESALKLPSEMPLRMYSETNSPLPDLAAFKTLALALRRKGKVAQERGASAEAVTAYMNIIQLGQRVEHGPLIALLVGIAIEKVGLGGAEQLTPRLSPAEREDLAHQIESFDRERLAFSEVALRERYFTRRITRNPFKILMARWRLRGAMQKAEQKQQQLSSDFHRVAQELRVISKAD